MKNTATSSSTSTSTGVEDHPPLGNRVTNVVAPPPTVISDRTSEPTPNVKGDTGETHNIGSSGNNMQSSSATTTKSETHEAIQELQNHTTAAAMESLISSHQSMWSNNDRSNDRSSSNNNDNDVSAMIAQLQQRIGQLQYELQDRTKWEAIRLKEFLIMKEKEVTDQLRSNLYDVYIFFSKQVISQ